jgi:hypothetical protein
MSVMTPWRVKTIHPPQTVTDDKAASDPASAGRLDKPEIRDIAQLYANQGSQSAMLWHDPATIIANMPQYVVSIAI